jgi:hypothetical protein
VPLILAGAGLTGSSIEDPPNHFPQRTRKIPSNLPGNRVGRGTVNNENAFH